MDELYRDQILEHYKRPHNFGVVEGADLEYEDTNPFCGDEQHVFIHLDDDDRVVEVGFEGQGCAISTAATSLLTDELEGMSREELLRLPKEFVLELLGIDISATLPSSSRRIQTCCSSPQNGLVSSKSRSNDS